MSKHDLVTVRLDRAELDLLVEGLDRVEKDREFTLKVQPSTSEDAVQATDALQIARRLREELSELR